MGYKIVIGASKSATWKLGSELLQLWMGTNYSHVYVRWFLSTQEREIVYQASHGSVHYQELNNFTKDNTIVEEYILELSDSQFIKFSQKCIDLCGIPYSIMELLQIFISNITKGKVVFTDQPGYICSELMSELLEDFFNAKFDKPNFLLRPDDIMLFLRKNNTSIGKI